MGGQHRKFLCSPEIFEPIIGAITASQCCELEFKGTNPKAISAANWELPQAARTRFSERACGSCDVTGMAVTFPCDWFLGAAQVYAHGPQSQASPDLWEGGGACASALAVQREVSAGIWSFGDVSSFRHCCRSWQEGQLGTEPQWEAALQGVGNGSGLLGHC